MKKCLLISTLSLVLVIALGVEGSAQTKKEMTFSGTHYWSSTGKTFPIDSDRIVMYPELLGVRVNDSGDGPFHGASVHIVGVGYRTKGYYGYRGYVTWIDKDGDIVVWELLDTPAGASTSPGRLIDATGKYAGWQGTIEYSIQYPKAFPDGTRRGITRETAKIVAPQ